MLIDDFSLRTTADPTGHDADTIVLVYKADTPEEIVTGVYVGTHNTGPFRMYHGNPSPSNLVAASFAETDGRVQILEL